MGRSAGGNTRQLITILQATFRELGKDDVGYMAAAMTYYAFFSVFPLLLLATTILSLFLDPLQAEKFIFNNIAQVAPGSADLFQKALVDAINNRGNAGWLALIGIGTLAFTASGAFDALDKSVNRAWDAPPISNIIVGKLTSFAMMAVVAGLLLLSLVVSTVLHYTQRLAATMVELPGSGSFWQVVDIAGSFAVVFVGFVLMYRFIPRCDVRFRDVWLGALLAALVWTAAKEVFALYLGSSFANYSAVYGTLGAVIALLTWIYLSSLIILTGAEFTSETARVRGHLETLKHLAGDEEGPAAHTDRRSPWLPS